MHISSPIKHIEIALLDGQPRVKAIAELNNPVKIAGEEQYDCDVEHGEDRNQLTPAARMRTYDKVQRKASTHMTMVHQAVCLAEAEAWQAHPESKRRASSAKQMQVCCDRQADTPAHTL